jgi:hypothetical protein
MARVKDLSPAQLQQAGLDALVKELGVVGAVRFMQQFDCGRGDYTSDRHKWLPKGDSATIAAEIIKRRKSKPGPNGRNRAQKSRGR